MMWMQRRKKLAGETILDKLAAENYIKASID